MEARRRYRIGERLDRRLLLRDILIPKYPKTIIQPSKETYTLDLEVNAFINRSSPSKSGLSINDSSCIFDIDVFCDCDLLPLPRRLLCCCGGASCIILEDCSCCCSAFVYCTMSKRPIVSILLVEIMMMSFRSAMDDDDDDDRLRNVDDSRVSPTRFMRL